MLKTNMSLAIIAAALVGVFLIGRCSKGEGTSGEITSLKVQLANKDSLLTASRQREQELSQSLEDSISAIQTQLVSVIERSEYRITQLENRTSSLVGELREMVSSEAMELVDQALAQKDTVIAEKDGQLRASEQARADDRRVYMQLITVQDSVITFHEEKDRIQEALIARLERENKTTWFDKAKSTMGWVSFVYVVTDQAVHNVN